MFPDHTTLFGNKTTPRQLIAWVQDTAVAELLCIMYNFSEESNCEFGPYIGHLINIKKVL